MILKITILCESTKERAAVELISVSAPKEINLVDGEHVINSSEIARAADLLHAIRKVLESANAYTLVRP